MSLDFKLRYDQLREGDPTKPAEENEVNAENSSYNSPSNARNLCFIWADGKRQFISYAYLVGVEFSPGSEGNVLTLNFTAYLVTLKGYGLETLFTALLDHLPRQILQVEERYIQVKGTESTFVTAISVQLKD